MSAKLSQFHSETTSRTSSSPDLREQIQNLEYGRHFCILYESSHQRIRATVPFFREGFENGDHCLYIVHDRPIPEVESEFQEAGMDVPYQKDRGALSFHHARDAFLEKDQFLIDDILKYVEDRIRKTEDDGFSGLRSTGDMTWFLDTDVSPENVVEYEARLNKLIQGEPVLLLCQYQIDKFPADLIQNVLSTHPIAVVEDQVCSNPFYEPPELLLEDTRGQELLEWRIYQLQEYQDNQQQLEEKESLLNEIHHRVKNNMQVINSFLSMQTRNVESEEIDRAFRESIRRIRAMAMVHEKLYQTSDLTEVDFEEYLRDLVEGIVDTSNLHEELMVNIEVEECELDLDYGIACGLIANELVTNSLQHSLDSISNPTVDIKFGQDDAGENHFVLGDNGEGFGEAFDPQESSSTGLDIVRSLVNYELDGTIKFENDDGAKVRIIF